MLSCLSAWCTCEVGKEEQQKVMRRTASGGNKSPKKAAEKNIGLLADRQSIRQPAAGGDFGRPEDAHPPDAPPPLPPPTDAPPGDEEADDGQALSSESNSRHSRKKFGQRGRRGSHLAQRAPSEVEAAPPESTPEPVMSRLSTADGQGTLEDVFAQVASPESVYGVAQLDIAFFGVTVPGSRAGATIENEFEEKSCVASKDAAALARARQQLATREGIAVLCCKGKKPEQPNQDNFFYCQTSRFRLCCVADGHGEFGHWVSHWVVRVVLQRLLMELETTGALPEDATITYIFDLAHKTALHAAKAESFDVWLSGTTLTVAVIDLVTCQVVVGWVGDSRCVAGRIGAKGTPEVIAGTQDHKPQNPEEKRRIICSGGEVVRLQNDLPHRVFARGKEAPGLAMSRALGDMMAHSVGVTHAPSFRRFQLEEDACLLCCSDGVWEFIKNTEALKLVLPLGREGASGAARALVEESKKRWLSEEGNITDDITAIVLWGAA